mmetsp:Transcript_18018/g.31853  ORF Transcript_18018/g.31853 Transcript_18018/m.31853 type:complete len:179 (+) Transcript_18018:672-1208(+)
MARCATFQPVPSWQGARRSSVPVMEEEGAVKQKVAQSRHEGQQVSVSVMAAVGAVQARDVPRVLRAQQTFVSPTVAADDASSRTAQSRPEAPLGSARLMAVEGKRMFQRSQQQLLQRRCTNLSHVECQLQLFRLGSRQLLYTCTHTKTDILARYVPSSAIISTRFNPSANNKGSKQNK